MKAKQLTVHFTRTVDVPGRYHDGNGLFLNVKPSLSKQWVQRIVIRGKRRDIGLGGYPLVSLAGARKAAFENRQLARAGGDPAALRSRRAVPTFGEAVDKVIEIHRPSWKQGAKSEGQWRSSLRDYAMKRIGSMLVSGIGPGDVMAIILPIWSTKRETAKRVKQRISAVMKWAVAEGYRSDDPAGLAIDAALPKNGVAKRHHKAVPYDRVGPLSRPFGRAVHGCIPSSLSGSWCSRRHGAVRYAARGGRRSTWTRRHGRYRPRG